MNRMNFQVDFPEVMVRKGNVEQAFEEFFQAHINWRDNGPKESEKGREVWVQDNPEPGTVDNPFEASNGVTIQYENDYLTPINVHTLKEFGMVEPEDETIRMIYPLEKILSAEPDPEGNNISFVVTRERNSQELALKLPDGATIYLAVESIEELRTFEKMVASWEPNY